MPRKIEPSNWINAGFIVFVDPIDKKRRAAIANTLGFDEISDEVVAAVHLALGELIGDITIEHQRPTPSQSKKALKLIRDHAQSLQRGLFDLDDISMDFLVSQLLKQPGNEVDAVYAEIDNIMKLLKKLNRAAESAVLTVDEKVKIEDEVVSHRHKFRPPPNRPLRKFIAALDHIYKKVTGKNPSGYYSDCHEAKGKFFLFAENCLACLPENFYQDNIQLSNIALGQIIKDVLQVIKQTR